jgi:hypothetical protein
MLRTKPSSSSLTSPCIQMMRSSKINPGLNKKKFTLPIQFIQLMYIDCAAIEHNSQSLLKNPAQVSLRRQSFRAA